MGTQLRVTAAASGPIADSSRILGIDVVRGFALLGIFSVNAAFFGMPFGDLMELTPPESEGAFGKFVFWCIEVLCAGKFYPMFSILFGAGLAIIYESTRRAGRSFGWIYLRRLIVLAMFGAIHVLLLWYGDILLLYAFVGVVMLLLGRLSPKVLLVVAAVVYGVGVFTSLGFAALSSGDLSDSGVVSVRELPIASSNLEQFRAVLADWNRGEAYDSRMLQVEQTIQSQGPFRAAVFLRLFLYAFTLIYYVFVTIWIVLPCFCIGAALAKLGFFHSTETAVRKRFFRWGLAVGLPLSILSVYAAGYSDTFGGMATHLLSANAGGPVLSLAYISIVLTLVERNPQSQIAHMFGQLGRMALTGYLLESLTMSAVMSHWGLAWFGTMTWASRSVLVITLYAAIVLFAILWMKLFRYGPVEWLWRSLSYLEWQPLVRSNGD